MEAAASLAALDFSFERFGSYIYFMLAFSLVIFVHELGHFLVAKWCGIKVEVFSIGIGSRLVGFKFGDTDYRLSVLPLGGYVKMLGGEGDDETAPTNDPRAFPNKSVGARAAVLSAGVIMNMIFAFFLFLVIFRNGLTSMKPGIGKLDKDGPAARQRDAGMDSLRAGDLMLAVNGTEVADYNEVQIEITLTDADKPITFDVLRDGKRHTVTIDRPEGKPGGKSIVGFFPGLSTTVPEGTPPGAPLKAGEQIRSASFGGRTIAVDSFLDLQRALALSAGGKLTLTVAKAGVERTAVVEPKVDRQPAIGGPVILGGIRPRVQVEAVMPDSPAGQAGLRAGDVILEYRSESAQVALPSREELFKRIAEAGDKPIHLRVLRGSDVLTLSAVAQSRRWERRPMLGFGFSAADLDHPVVGEVISAQRVSKQTIKVLEARFKKGPDGSLGTDGDSVMIALSRLRGREFPDAAAAKAALIEVLGAQLLDAHGAAVLDALETTRPYKAGVRSGDVIVSFAGKPAASWNDLVREIAVFAEGVAIKRTDDGEVETKAAELVVTRDGATVKLSLPILPLEYELDSLPVSIGVPFQVERTVIRGETAGEALRMGLHKTWYTMKQVYVTLAQMIRGQLGADNLSGPLGIAAIGGKFAEQDTMLMWYILAAISVNLAVLNFLPIPVLDGGHIVFLIIEKIRGSPVPVHIYDRVNKVGLLVLLSLFLFVTFNDVTKFFK